MIDQVKSKSDRTKEYLLETLAPVFSRNGYAATSLSEISKATGLSKGAIYGNFENKEQLALAAFNYNLKKVLKKLNAHVAKESSPIHQLKAITSFYREYYAYAVDFGGCPLITGGVDSNHQNPLLFARVKQMTSRIRSKIVDIILTGVEQGEIKANLDPQVYANRIFSMIEGSLFLGIILTEPNCTNDMMDHIDLMIDSELRK